MCLFYRNDSNTFYIMTYDLDKYEIFMRHHLVKQFAIIIHRGFRQQWQLDVCQIKHVVDCRHCGVIKLRAAIMMQPCVKVGGHNVIGFSRFLDALFVLFE